MTKASQRISTGKSGQLQKRRSTKNDKLSIWLVGGGAVITLILVILVLNPPKPGDIAGVVTYGNLARDHSSAPVTYPQTPPVGGVHNPVWQNCGIYDQPVHNENAVHSLEHGSVWITYQPDLPADAVEHLRSLVRGHDHLLLSPYPGLPRPVVASAWGLQLQLDDANDSRLPLFITHYEQGPQTPEPGAVCNGGVGKPIE
jgi:Protein of unknown function (DUF3105)